MSSSSINIEAKVEAWKNKGFLCEIWSLDPGKGWSDSGHEGDEVFILLEGNMQASLGTDKHNLEVGEEFFVPAHKPHETYNTGNTANRFYWIHAYHWSPYPGKESADDVGRKIS